MLNWEMWLSFLRGFLFACIFLAVMEYDEVHLLSLLSTILRYNLIICEGNYYNFTPVHLFKNFSYYWLHYRRASGQIVGEKYLS